MTKRWHVGKYMSKDQSPDMREWAKPAIEANQRRLGPDIGNTLCIYCGKPDLTKKHIYGKWTREYALGTAAKSMPGKQGRSHHTIVEFENFIIDHKPKKSKGKMNRPGAMQSQTLRIVCRDCNGGWMKRIVDNAKPTLANLMLGYWGSEAQDSRQSLSAWIALVSMNFEFAHRNTVCVPQKERDFIRDTGTPSHSWQIFLGHMEPFLHGEDPINHRGLVLPPYFAKDRHDLCQITTLSIGKMVALAIYCDVDYYFDMPGYCGRYQLSPVFPIEEGRTRRPFKSHRDPWCHELMKATSDELGLAFGVTMAIQDQ